MTINNNMELISIIKDSDYEKCTSMEIISVFSEDISQVTAKGAQVEYYYMKGMFEEILSSVKALPKADKMIVYSLQNPNMFDEEELDRMCKCFDTMTGMKTAYGLKMTEKYPSQFHIFIRKKEV